jgi:ATP-dependent Lon protease
MVSKRIPKPKELTANELRWKCDPALLEFESTTELEPIESIVGQERALKALKLGVDINAPGYNIYIAGLSGTGKQTSVKQLLEKISTTCPQLYDYVYVNNFQDPDCPLLLMFPAGKAKEFKKDIETLISFLREKIPLHLDSESYINKKKAVLDLYKDQQKNLLGEFEERLRKDGFSLGQVQVGDVTRPDIVPLVDNKPVALFQLSSLVEEGKLTQENVKQINNKYDVWEEELYKVFKQGMKIEQEIQNKATELEKNEVETIIKGALSDILDKYQDEKVLKYLANVKTSILNHLQIFKGQKPEGKTVEDFSIDDYHEYEVNIILDNSGTKKSPVIVEITPNSTNLFGTIEKTNDGRGSFYADFTKIKAGSLLKANGGYLVLRAIHLFEEPGVWQKLKRVLNYRQLEIQDAFSFYPLSPSILKPEPIEITAKIILMGSNHIYSLLSGYEDDFKKIFKVKADFDDEITRTNEIMVEYARVIKKLIRNEKLLEFNKSAIAYMLELAARYAGNKQKLTTRFSFLADIAREANFWALQNRKSIVSANDVKNAYTQARVRHSLQEDKISEMILENSILIETSGERVGCINGLAVYGNDYYAFGKPVRITSTVSLGSGGFINVEREAGLSGKTYDKGVLIISGYIRETFGKNFPLSFVANFVFEQSYGPVDGDSASAAEVYTLISSLSELPLKQSYAVTGSVNQKGEIQPIGGVNEKIEGFFDICKSRGLTRKQGVIIPAQNIRDLMLRDDVVQAVKRKEFHIFPIEKIEDGVRILLGKEAGSRDDAGQYTKNSVFELVDHNLKRMYDKAKEEVAKKHKTARSKKNDSPRK